MSRPMQPEPAKTSAAHTATQYRCWTIESDAHECMVRRYPHEGEYVRPAATSHHLTRGGREETVSSRRADLVIFLGGDLHQGGIRGCIFDERGIRIDGCRRKCHSLPSQTLMRQTDG